MFLTSQTAISPISLVQLDAKYGMALKALPIGLLTMSAVELYPGRQAIQYCTNN